MNIVFLNDSGHVNGGAAKVALSEARSMAEMGHQVHLVCGVGPVADDLMEQANLKVHCLGLADVNEDSNRLRAVTFGWWNPITYKYVRNLLQSLERENTVVHVHSWTRALSSSAIKAAIDCDYAVVVTLHDYLLACPQGTFFLHNTQEKCRLKPMSLSCVCTNCDASSYHNKLWRTGRKLTQSIISGVPSRVKEFIYLSRTSLEVLRPHLSASSTFHNLPNPIASEYRPPADVASHNSFIFVGRLVPEKGAVMFAGAAAAEGVPAKFIGEGPERKAIISINPQAQISGWMSHSDTMQALRTGRALVFPSLWHEALGLTVLEAAANGLASIVPHDCAAAESVVDGVTGLHFRSGDQADLRAKITLLKDRQVAAQMGQAAHARFWAAPEFTMAAHASELERIYRRVLKIA